MRRRSWLLPASLAVVITAWAIGQAACGQTTPPRAAIARARAAALQAPITSFLWGVSTAGYQSEGGDQHSNWTHWHPQDPAIEPIGRAVDFWNRYEEDMGHAASLGVNAFRMSVEWARVEPQPGQWDQDAIAHYRAMIRTLQKHHMEPLLTLSHWTMPQWIDEQGGWTNPETPKRFARFVEKVTTEVAPETKVWVTFNEPNVWLVRDYFLGIFPPNRRSLSDLISARDNVLAGHALAYDIIHRHHPQALVSANLYHVDLMKGSFLAWPLGTDVMDNQWTFEAFRDATSPDGHPPPPHGRLDYLSYDYYYAFRTIDDMANLRDPWKVPVNPAQLTDVILSYHRRFGLPQLIAENGLATEHGKPRPDGRTPAGTLVETVDAMREAVKGGARLMGYCYWTLTDNYEWGTFAPRFGLFAVEHTDPELRRTPTPTADTYRQVIRRERLRGLMR
jgi:beta-glucosidase